MIGPDAQHIAFASAPQRLLNVANTILYVADYANNLVRPIVLASRTVTSIGVTGGAFSLMDGVGSSSYFARPGGVAVDAADVLFVGDTNNNVVRAITGAGTVSPVVRTIAGGGGLSPETAGFFNSAGVQALFSSPRGAAMDAFGRVFVADFSNWRIRRIDTATSLVTTAAGSAIGNTDGTGTNAAFYCWGVAADMRGNVFFSDYQNNRIRRLVVATGVVTTVAGTTVGWLDGYGTNARLNYPTGLSFAGGRIFVADNNNNAVRSVQVGFTADDDDWFSPNQGPPLVTTVAGAGPGAGAGYVDAVGTNAKFNNLQGVAADATGATIYVADTSNHLVRKIVVATRAVTTLAGGLGATTAGFVNAVGTNAAFNTLRNVAVDALGNVFVADTGNNVIRVVSPNGTTTTYAGGGTAGADGLGAAANFNQPYGLSLAPTGALVVVDATGDRVRLIVQPSPSMAASALTTRSPTSTRSVTFLTTPSPSRTPLLAVVTGLAGGGRTTPTGRSDGLGTAARMSGPIGTVVVGSLVYVSDTANNVVRYYNPASGLLQTLAGGSCVSCNTAGSANGAGVAATFSGPRGLAADVDNMLLYVADTVNNLIRRIDLATTFVTKLAGGGSITGTLAGYADATAALAQFSAPQNIAFSTAAGSVLFVADFGNNLVRMVVAASGVTTTVAGGGGGGGTTPGFQDGTGTGAFFNNPSGVTVDAAGATLYIAEYTSNRIRKIVLAGGGVVTTLVGGGSALGTNQGYVDLSGTAALFKNPWAAVLAPSGLLWVSDYGNSAVRVVNISTLAVTTVAGNPLFAPYAGGINDALGTAAAFNGPVGLAPDAAGKVYVADLSNNALRVIAAGTAAVTTVAGAGSGFSTGTGFMDGPGLSALFALTTVNGLATDCAGLVFVADSNNNAVRVINATTGITATLAGGGSGCYGNGGCGFSGYVDGVGSSVRFNAPRGIAADFKGNVFVSEWNNHAIRRVIVSTGAVTTVAGGGTQILPSIGTNAKFLNPMQVAVSGNVLFVADYNNNLIRQIVLSDGVGVDDDDLMDVGGAVSVLAGGGCGGCTTAGFAVGAGTNALFWQPRGIAVDAAGTTVYTAEWTYSIIRKIVVSTGDVTVLAGGNGGVTTGYANDVGTDAMFRNPMGITLDAAGNLFVADYNNYVIRRRDDPGRHHWHRLHRRPRQRRDHDAAVVCRRQPDIDGTHCVHDRCLARARHLPVRVDDDADAATHAFADSNAQPGDDAVAHAGADLRPHVCGRRRRPRHPLRLGQRPGHGGAAQRAAGRGLRRRPGLYRRLGQQPRARVQRGERPDVCARGRRRRRGLRLRQRRGHGGRL